MIGCFLKWLGFARMSDDSNDPLERTRYHEAGHAFVYWELFAMISPQIVAIGDFDGEQNYNTGGWMRLEGFDLSYLDVCLHRDLITVFFAGRKAVAMAIKKKRLNKMKTILVILGLFERPRRQSRFHISMPIMWNVILIAPSTSKRKLCQIRGWS